MLSFIGFLICAILLFYAVHGISDLANTASESQKLKRHLLQVRSILQCVQRKNV